jgi:ketosteroid isomerase-like protein
VGEADENVIRAAFERWNSGAHDADPELIDPEIEIVSALAQATFRGYDGTVRWAAEIDEQFQDWKVELYELRPLDDGRYLLEGAIHGRGRQSGVDLDQDASWLVELRDGRIVRFLNFIGRDTAARTLEEP